MERVGRIGVVVSDISGDVKSSGRKASVHEEV